MIYITGDMHGEEYRIRDRRLNKLNKGDTLIVCGDFGFLWDGSQKEKRLLNYLGSRKYSVAFIDGTHENYDLLKKYRMTVWKGGRVHRISGNLFHMIRGQIFDIDGFRIFAFGGGESLDREIRTEHKTWWRDEFPTSEEMAEGAENIDEAGCKVDYIVTHEPPSLVKSSLLLRNGEPDRVNKLNGYFEQLDRECRFTHWFFGSMHEDRTVTKAHTAVFNEIIPVEEYIEQLRLENPADAFIPKVRKRTADKQEHIALTEAAASTGLKTQPTEAVFDGVKNEEHVGEDGFTLQTADDSIEGENGFTAEADGDFVIEAPGESSAENGEPTDSSDFVTGFSGEAPQNEADSRTAEAPIYFTGVPEIEEPPAKETDSGGEADKNKYHEVITGEHD